MLKRTCALVLSFVMAFTVLVPNLTVLAVDTAAAQPAAADAGIVVDDTVTDSTLKHYFTYTAATDPTGHRGWAADTKASIIGDTAAKTQHWVWDESPAEAGKHTYTFTFEGTGVEIYGVKNDNKNVFQLDENDPEVKTITGNGQNPVVLYEKKGLTAGKHVVKATLPAGEGTGLQVCYAKVFGAETEPDPQPEPDPETAQPHGVATTIRHDKQTGDSNKFTYSQNGTWTVSGTHSWSNRGTKDEVWYTVNFVGNAIDVYSGKNNPMGIVAYYIDDVFKGEFSLFRNGNIDEEFIVQFAGLTEGEHTFKAVATGKRAEGSTNTLIDAAKVVVYHEPYTVTGASCTDTRLEMKQGGTHALALSLVPDYTSLADVEFAASDPAVAAVSAQGVVEAKGVGSAEITVTAKTGGKQLLAIPVTVTEATLSMGGSIVDVDTQYTQDRYEEVKALHTASASLTAWRNDKAISEIALVSKDCRLTGVTVSASDLTGADGAVIPASNVETSFITSTTAYAGGYPGYGSQTRPVPQGHRKESNDILYQAGSVPMDIPFNAVQPVFVKINVPEDAKAGDYTTTLTVTAEGLAQPLTFTYTLTVQDAVLKDAAAFKDSFDIELWQYPYSVAEYYGVTAFGPEHLAIMQPHMELYKEIGGHAITATIIEDAWDGQTYSKNTIHYPSMIRWEKKNGQMTYDYTDFDKWVEFNRGLGIGDKIVLYSVAPWHNSFTYWENDRLVKQTFASLGGVGSADYNSMWKHFLTDLAKHLDEKDWFDAAYIGIDERGLTHQALDVVASVTNKDGHHFKTAGALNRFEEYREVAMRMTDINIGDNCVVGANAAAFDRFLAEREKLGLRTTLYTCTEHRPSNFSLSGPVESYWTIINAGEKTAGMLRWAYDAWVEDPLRDATHNAFEPGDCFLVYPDEKTAAHPVTKSSLRLERMAQGVRDVNKLRQMVAKYPDMQADVDALYEGVTTQAYISHDYLPLARQQEMGREMNAFRDGIHALTAKYLDPRAHGGYEYTRVPRAEITDIHADSQTSPAQGNDGPAAWAFDGNAATLWHSNYGSGKTPCPHEISWKIGTAKEIGRIQYVARPSGSNGNWKKITVQGRNGNGEWFDLVTDMTLASGSKNITFAPRTVTELKVIVSESYGDQADTFATAAEIVTYEADLVTTIHAKRQALRDQYADVCEISTANYTPESVARLNEAKAQARAVFGKDEVTDAEIEAAAKALTDAVSGLQVDADKLAPGAPAGGTSVNNPFPNQGDAGCITDNIRIPAIITLDNGWLAAAADARWDHHGDHGNIDGMFSISKDNGKTWNYTFPMFFNDSTNLFHDYAATLMDPVLTQGEDGRLYMLIDAFPGGHALSAWAPLKPSGNSGFVDVKGTRRLAVYENANNKDTDVNSYRYYVGDFSAENDAVTGKKLAPVLEKGGDGKTAAYYVDEWFNLYTADKSIMVCPQIGSDKFVQQNLFYYNADLHLRSATFLMLMTSDDNGATWSQPTLVDAAGRGENTMFYGIGPGAGLSFVDAQGTNVIILPTYVHPNEYSGFIYSTDRGETWTCAPNVSYGSSESCIVQLNENTVRKFTRSGATQVQYADYTWHPETSTFTVGEGVQIAGTSKTANNQVSAVRYPQTMDGKPVILVSTATGGNRGHGRIYTLSVEQDGTMRVLNTFNVSNDNYDYHYSSLTVNKDGDIALFYEDNFGGRGWGAGGTSHHTFLTIPAESLGLTGVLTENAYTFNIPLYSEMNGSLAPVPADADLTALNESGLVHAALRDGKVFYTGLKAGTHTLRYTKNGQNITVTLNVAKDSAVQDQDVVLQLGESQKFDVTGEITYQSNEAVVGTAMETTSKTVTMGQTGTDKNFTGAQQPLTDALFTFTHKTGSNYTIQNGEIYLALNGIPHATLPYSKSAQDIAVEMRGDSFTMHVEGAGWLWFWKNDTNKLHFDRNSAHTANCNFDLFRTAQAGEACPEIPGFVKLTSMSEIEDGGKYLIAVKAANGQYYVMRASDSGDKYQHVLHVTGEKSVPASRTLTLTGLTAGKAVVVAGNTAFHVTVKAPVPAKLYGASLSLAGDVGVNFFYEFADAFLADETASVEMKLPNNEKLIFRAAEGVKDTASVPGKTLYKFTAHVAVRQMTEAITVKVMQGGRMIGTAVQYSVRDYAHSIMNDTEDKYTDGQKAFVKAMLYHGAAMQIYKGHNPQHLATEGLRADDMAALDAQAKAVDPAKLPAATRSGRDPEGLTLYGVNLSLQDETTLSFFFTKAEGVTAADYTFRTGAYQNTVTEPDGRIRVEVSDIAASRLGDVIPLTVGELTVSYSPLTYARTVLKSEQSSDALKQVARSLVVYHNAAAALEK